MRAKKLILSMLVVAIFSWLSQAESWALDAYMRIVVSGSQEIPGSSTHPGYTGWHPVAAFGHSVSVPLDANSGAPTGNRQHNPIRIVKPVDEGSPLIYQALGTGQNLELVQIDFLRVNASGQEENFFTIKLENALISGVSQSLIPSNQDNQMMETVTFSYMLITWIDKTSDVEYSDGWGVP